MRWIFVRTFDGRVRAGWRYLLYIVALVLAGVVSSGIVHLLALPPLRSADGFVLPGSVLARGLLLTGATLAVTAVFLRFVEGRRLSSIGLPLTGPWRQGIAAGFLLGAAPVVLLVAVLVAAGHGEVGVATITPASLAWAWLPTVLGLALISSLEEIALRGYGLQLLSEAGGRWFGAIVTGAMFGLMHAENPGANLLGLVNTAANGILLAWLVMRTGSLWIACAYHAGWNITGAMILGMRLSGLDHPSGLLVARLSGPDWLTGGAYGFEGSALVGPIEFAILSLAVALAPRLPGHPEVAPFFSAAGSALPVRPGEGDGERSP
jgi:membrane protease YdiL (CAAX protease family)